MASILLDKEKDTKLLHDEKNRVLGQNLSNENQQNLFIDDLNEDGDDFFQNSQRKESTFQKENKKIIEIVKDNKKEKQNEEIITNLEKEISLQEKESLAKKLFQR